MRALKDPLRPEVKQAVALAKKAGIKIVIITGDYSPTAQAIAEEVGIVPVGSCPVVRGVDLESMSDQATVEEAREGSVIFARVSLEQTLRIVKTLKQNGEVVAVTCERARTSLFKTSLRSNKWIWLGIAAQISIVSFFVYVPFIQGFFGTTALGLYDWGFLATLACVVVFAEEIRKWFSRRLTTSETVHGKA